MVLLRTPYLQMCRPDVVHPARSRSIRDCCSWQECTGTKTISARSSLASSTRSKGCTSMRGELCRSRSRPCNISSGEFYEGDHESHTAPEILLPITAASSAEMDVCMG